MEIQGKVVKVLEPTKYTSKKDGSEQYIYGFVIETSGQYTRKVFLQVFGSDRWSHFGLVVGSSGTFSFDVQSREWNGRWFTELTCFNVSLAVSASSPSASAIQTAVVNKEYKDARPAPSVAEEDDSLPF